MVTGSLPTLSRGSGAQASVYVSYPDSQATWTTSGRHNAIINTIHWEGIPIFGCRIDSYRSLVERRDDNNDGKSAELAEYSMCEG